MSFKADVLSDDDCNNVMHGIDSEWGRLDILINNVGGGGRWGKKILKIQITLYGKKFIKKMLMQQFYLQEKLFPYEKK